MSLFWFMTAVLAASAAAVVIAFASRGRTAPAEAPEIALYRRQLEEVDDLQARGLLGEAEHAAARAEAGRRLLRAGERTAAQASDRGNRAVLLAAVAGTALLALGLYFVVGSPGREDAPYAKRLAEWRAADPAALPPAALAALAQDLAERRPEDPDAWRFLGRARLQTGEAFAAVRALERAAELGGTAEDYAALGEALAAFNEGQVGESAAAAFAEAVRRDPTSVPARYGVALGRLTAGDEAGGRAALAELAASLPPGDARRTALEAELARTDNPPPGARR